MLCNDMSWLKRWFKHIVPHHLSPLIIPRIHSACVTETVISCLSRARLVPLFWMSSFGDQTMGLSVTCVWVTGLPCVWIIFRVFVWVKQVTLVSPPISTWSNPTWPETIPKLHSARSRWASKTEKQKNNWLTMKYPLISIESDSNVNWFWRTISIRIANILYIYMYIYT